MAERVAALLRGINVGGHRPLPMPALREALAAAGYTGVQTYVQSGNVVFRAPGAAGPTATALRAAVAQASPHLDPAVALRTPKQMQAVVDHCPFDDTATVHVTFLVEGATSTPLPEGLERFAPEEAVARGREVYLHLPGGMGRSKLAAVLGRGPAGADGTTRNWRTVTTLLQMALDA
jgi:uncharacterized protein (DUF1697 family)